MSTQTRPSTNGGGGPANPNAQSTTNPEKTYFESQREMLVSEIAQSLEHVLQNINKLNRSLEEVIAVGLEFSPVEALWSQFENVMAKEGEDGGAGGGGGGGGGKEGVGGGAEGNTEGSGAQDDGDGEADGSESEERGK